MRDINEPIRVAYLAALTQIDGMEVYYQSLPNNLNPDNYLVFRSINSTDTSSKSSSRVDLNITVEIHTKNNIANPGLTADNIADQIFNLVYPDKQTNLTLSRGQILWTQIANDRTLDYTLRNQSGYIDRFLTFRHGINIDTTGSGGTSMTVQGRIFRLEYSGVGGEVGFSAEQLMNKNILAVFKDGIEFSEIITSGLPTMKQVKYTAATGTLLFDIAIEPDEEIAVLYQLANPYSALVYDYVATGGETGFTSALLVGKQIQGVSRDGVNASQILSSGTPVGKEVLYETATGGIEFEIPMEAGERIKVLYQL